MKEFDLEAAKAGKAVCTRDSRAARIICWDKKGKYPIVALIDDTNGGEIVIFYDENGYVWGHIGIEDMTRFDLMMTSEKKEGWINLYRVDGDIETGEKIFPSKESAISEAYKACYIDTVKIEWEE